MENDEICKAEFTTFHYHAIVYITTMNYVNKNQKWDPLSAMKTFIRRKVGHTT